jgi:hypothetical protein
MGEAMPDINRVEGLRTVAQLGGTVLLLADGLLVLPFCFGALFTVKNWWDVISLAAILVILPLSVGALFKPRFVAYAAAIVWIILLVPHLGYTPPGGEMTAEGLRLFLYVTVPLVVASASLFYASTTPSRKPGDKT